jgi:hypothetical protein
MRTKEKLKDKDASGHITRSRIGPDFWLEFMRSVENPFMLGTTKNASVAVTTHTPHTVFNTP